jgi:antiviral helicase SKI2
LKQWQDKKRKEKDLSVVNEKLEETTKSSTEFDNRLKVLKELNYIDSNDLPLIKARIAKEVGSIFVSEILVNNVL